MLALSGLRDGFARGLVSLHTPPFLGGKSSAVKSNHSHTCVTLPQAQSLLLLMRYQGGWSYQFDFVVADLKIGFYNGESASPSAAARRGWLYNERGIDKSQRHPCLKT